MIKRQRNPDAQIKVSQTELLGALRSFLTPDRPVSARYCGYHLLSMGVLQSTKQFHNLNRRMNRYRIDEKLDDECFVDNKRRVELQPTWEDLTDFRQWCSAVYKQNLWRSQPKHVEIWLEKDTTAFLIQDIADKYRVPLRVSSGHYSRSFLYKAAKELSSVEKSTVVLYLGDFDPSGLDIERAARRGNNNGNEKKEGVSDILEARFGWSPDRFDEQVEWIRVGVTEADFLALPESAKVPIKEDSQDDEGNERRGDPRAQVFKERYGDLGAEVEALEVQSTGEIARRVEEAILTHLSFQTWKRAMKKEEKDKEELVA
jgi:hypothetical protein